MIYGVTGHRPEKIDGYYEDKRVRQWLNEFADAMIQNLTAQTKALQPTKVLTGMALGWDTAIADACRNHNVDFVAYVPFDGFELLWPYPERRHYHTLLQVASKVVYCCDAGYEWWKLRRRNCMIVDNCQVLLAMYNGDKTGGTQHCVEYADQVHRETFLLWKSWLHFRERKLNPLLPA